MKPERDPFADRRAHPRKKVIRAARVIFNDRQSLIDCTILDLSDGGAKLEFPSRQV
ncbi:MAG: PilZ domain-containing protein, partial [Dongiaceae bacterium]